MAALFWNYRGINNGTTVQALRSLIRDHRPSIVFLSETQVHDLDYFESLRTRLGFPHAEEVLSFGQSGGLGLFWNDNVDIHVRAKDTYFIDAVVDGQNPNVASWRLTCFYGHPTRSERHRSWETLRTLSDEDSLPWLVLGDCNEIVSSSEKVGGRSHSEHQMQDFRDALDYCGLYDQGFTGPMYTWWDCLTKIYLDRAMATSTCMVGFVPPFQNFSPLS